MATWCNIFKRKSDNPKAPKLSGDGECPHCGKAIDFALWVATDRETGEPKKTRNGDGYFSMKLDEPRQQSGPRAVPEDDTDDLF